jgi:hypothetical protein
MGVGSQATNAGEEILCPLLNITGKFFGNLCIVQESRILGQGSDLASARDGVEE